MTFLQELASWNPFQRSFNVQPVPKEGELAPSLDRLTLPQQDGRATVIAFLRHCGCPFAEKTFIQLREVARKHANIHFIAISHSNEQATSKWLNDVGGKGQVEVIVDVERQLYAAYGLGLSSFWHNLNPWSMASVSQLQKTDNISLRPTESGSRWQTAGLFAVDNKGRLQYVHIANAADDLGNLAEAVDQISE